MTNSFPFITLFTGNDAALSDAISSGNPWVANRARNTLMVTADEVDGMIVTSSHLEWVSITTRRAFLGGVLYGQYEFRTRFMKATPMGALV